jgi:hypothetical protein
MKIFNPRKCFQKAEFDKEVVEKLSTFIVELEGVYKMRTDIEVRRRNLDHYTRKVRRSPAVCFLSKPMECATQLLLLSWTLVCVWLFACISLCVCVSCVCVLAGWLAGWLAYLLKMSELRIAREKAHGKGKVDTHKDLERFERNEKKQHEAKVEYDMWAEQCVSAIHVALGKVRLTITFTLSPPPFFCFGKHTTILSTLGQSPPFVPTPPLSFNIFRVGWTSTQ